MVLILSWPRARATRIRASPDLNVYLLSSSIPTFLFFPSSLSDSLFFLFFYILPFVCTGLRREVSDWSESFCLAPTRHHPDLGVVGKLRTSTLFSLPDFFHLGAISISTILILRSLRSSFLDPLCYWLNPSPFFRHGCERIRRVRPSSPTNLHPDCARAFTCSSSW